MTKLAGNKEALIRSVGRRKSSSARARLEPGSGEITVNGQPFTAYFSYFEYQNLVSAPLRAVGKEKIFTISVKVAGGGVRGQATAVQHAIARALVLWNEELRKTLKSQGFLRRDPRVKERKKFGLKKARRAPQWAKR